MTQISLLLISIFFAVVVHGHSVVSFIAASHGNPETSANPHANITERVLMDTSLIDSIREAQKICKHSIVKKGKRVQQNVLCPSWKKRFAVIVRWLQISQIYPYKPLQRIVSTGASLELVKADQSDATFASPLTIDFLTEFSKTVHETSGHPLRVTALTTGPDEKTDFHRSHLTGFVFDVRPLPGTVPTTWREPNKKIYDYKLNRDMVVNLLSRPEVKKIIFNDPRIRNDKLVKKTLYERGRKGYKPAFLLSDIDICQEQKWKDCDLKAHENHLHVELNLPESLERVARLLLEETDRRPLRTTSLKEDFPLRELIPLSTQIPSSRKVQLSKELTVRSNELECFSGMDC